MTDGISQAYRDAQKRQNWPRCPICYNHQQNITAIKNHLFINHSVADLINALTERMVCGDFTEKKITPELVKYIDILSSTKSWDAHWNKKHYDEMMQKLKELDEIK